jgi:hypothetical protein
MSQQGSRNRGRPGDPGSGQGGASRGGQARGRRTSQAERRAAAEARLRAERQRERRRRLIYAVAGLVAILLVGGGLVALALSRNSTSSSAAAAQIVPDAPTGNPTVQQPVNQVQDKSGIPGVLAWNTGDWPGAGTATAAGTLEHQHVPGPVTYSITPPVGGPHNPVWMNAGVYDKPIPPERGVHNLEHGAVWITYRPDLPAAQVKALRSFVDRQSLIAESTGIAGQQNRYVDLSPWTGNDLPSPIVISAWGHQLRVDAPDDPRLQQFVDTFRHNQAYTPEFGSAVDGVPVQTGGRPVADGGTVPNPAGSVPSGVG